MTVPVSPSTDRAASDANGGESPAPQPPTPQPSAPPPTTASDAATEQGLSRALARLPGPLAPLALRHRRFLSFCLVGASGVFVNLVVFWVVLAALEGPSPQGRSWWIDNTAVFVGWFVSVASNFVLNDRLTFRDVEAGYASGWLRRMSSYYTSALVAFGIQWLCFNGLLWALDSSAGAPLHELARADGVVAWAVALGLRFQRTFANLTGIGVATIANYLLAKHWVFKRDPGA